MQRQTVYYPCREERWCEPPVIKPVRAERTIMSVFVLDKRKKPLMPCSEKRASLLLKKGRARVHRLVPFTIRLIDRFQETSVLQMVEVKIDPGSKTTGIAVVLLDGKAIRVKKLIEITHRGMLIKRAMVKRAACRRNRRNRNTRYRQPRFDNRTRPKGWLAPSLQHRVLTTMSWVNRLIRWAPVACIAYERVNFDMQRMENANIQGVQYQQGSLYKKEVMEYLLEKFDRKCVYCDGKSGDERLEIEHSTPRSLGGSNSLRNLLLACRDCNVKKGALPLAFFLQDRPELLAKLQRQLKTPLRDAAVVSATKNALFIALLKTGLPVAQSTGAQTKLNRATFDVPKTHAMDAACVGDIESIRIESAFTLDVKSTGRGRHQRCLLDKYGFPRSYLGKTKRFFGFATGDIAKFTPSEQQTLRGVKPCTARIAVRSSGFFSATVKRALINQPQRSWKLLQKADGYSYNQMPYQLERIEGGRRYVCIGSHVYS